MKVISLLLAPVLAASLGSCTNLTLLGHVAAYDVNAEFKGDPVVPIGMNAGFESRSFVAVPPKNSVYWQDNIMSQKKDAGSNSYTLPTGDVLPTISKLRIQAVPSTAAIDGVAFDFVSSGATGKAAIAAAGGIVENTAPQSTDLTVPSKANNLAQEIKSISSSVDSIPLR